MKHIITLSGGLTSAYVAKLVLEKQKDAELVFTDTHWETEDLHRFLRDLEVFFNKRITRISRILLPKNEHRPRNKFDILVNDEMLKDGYIVLDPPKLFNAVGILGSNRSPVCSRHLKVAALLKYVKREYKNKVTLYYGIDHSEAHRATRITARMNALGIKTSYPLIDAKLFFIRDVIEKWLASIGIDIPKAYLDGDAHNNCGGGCVRQGKKGWIHCYYKHPEIYAKREIDEANFKGGKYTYMKNLSLRELRKQIEEGKIETAYEDSTPCICFEV